MTERIGKRFFKGLVEIDNLEEGSLVEWKTKNNLPLWEALGYLNMELSQMEKDRKRVGLQYVRYQMVDTIRYFNDPEVFEFSLDSTPVSLNSVRSARGDGRAVITNFDVYTDIADFKFITDPASFINQLNLPQLDKILKPETFQLDRSKDFIPHYRDVLVTDISILVRYNLSSAISELVADTLGRRFDPLMIQQSTESYLREHLKHLPQVE